jgi:hypothetical protein
MRPLRLYFTNLPVRPNRGACTVSLTNRYRVECIHHLDRALALQSHVRVSCFWLHNSDYGLTLPQLHRPSALHTST